MLVALHKASDYRIESPGYSSGHEIRALFKKDELCCPFCESSVFPRDRQGFVLHFVHKTECSTTLGHHAESPEHLLGKGLLAQELKEELKDYSNVEVLIEYAIHEAGENGRIADVAAVFPTGYVLVYECQLSNITTDELEQRTEDYRNAGVDVTWWFGKSADNQRNQSWSIGKFGTYYTIQFGASRTDTSAIFDWHKAQSAAA